MFFQDKLCPGALCAFVEVARPGANIHILSLVSFLVPDRRHLAFQSNIRVLRVLLYLVPSHSYNSKAYHRTVLSLSTSYKWILAVFVIL